MTHNSALPSRDEKSTGSLAQVIEHTKDKVETLEVNGAWLNQRVTGLEDERETAMAEREADKYTIARLEAVIAALEGRIAALEHIVEKKIVAPLDRESPEF